MTAATLHRPLRKSLVTPRLPGAISQKLKLAIRDLCEREHEKAIDEVLASLTEDDFMEMHCRSMESLKRWEREGLL